MISRLAIDLSGNTVRMLAGSVGGRMKAAEAKVPASVMSDGLVLNSASLAPIIKELAAQVDGKEGKAAIAASDSLASFRIINVAKDATDAKVESLVRAQLPLDGNRMGMQRVEVAAQAEIGRAAATHQVPDQHRAEGFQRLPDPHQGRLQGFGDGLEPVEQALAQGGSTPSSGDIPGGPYWCPRRYRRRGLLGQLWKQ